MTTTHASDAIRLLPVGWGNHCPPGVLQMAICLAGAGVLAGGHLEASISTSIALAVVAGASFICLGGALKYEGNHETFQKAGKIMLDRVRDTETNWQQHTMRSFLEVFSWLYTIYQTFEAGASFPLAIFIGTSMALPMVLVGEALGAFFRWVERQFFLREGETDEKLKNGQFYMHLAWLVYFGGVFWMHISKNRVDYGNAVLVSVLTGAAFINAGQLLTMWNPTFPVGVMMQHRITHMWENWCERPLRSAVETSAYIGSICGAFALSNDLLVSVLVGTTAGIAICIVSEFFLGVMTPLKDEEVVKNGRPMLVLLCLFTNLTLTTLYYIFHNLEDLTLAATLAVLSSAAYAAVGRLCIIVPPSREMGYVLEGRITNAKENWMSHPMRSAYEILFWQCCTFATYTICGDLFTSIQAGVMIGGMNIILVNEFGNYVEKEFLAWSDGDWSKTTSKKISLPPTAAVPRGSSPQAQIAYSEVQKHNSREDAWLVIHGKVYDITDWIDTHPGGAVIDKFLGNDATDQFEAFHMPRVRNRLKARRCVGEVALAPKSRAATLAYRTLREHLWETGWFVPHAGYFVVKHLVCGLFLAGALLFAMGYEAMGVSALPAAVISGISCGVFLQQSAFLAHDQLHNGIIAPPSGGGFNWLGWIHGSLIFGISSRMWLYEHSVHHACTLRPTEDLQFNYLPLWIISEKELQVWKGGAAEKFLSKVLVPWQHWTFLPLTMLVARYNLHAISVVHAIKNLCLDDLLGMGLHFTWYIALCYTFPGGEYARLAFHLASFWTAGILHVQLLVSHLATETFTTEEERAEQFFTFQLKTTRNIDTEWWDSWFHGGLQYQIEHHLFPQLPRHNLKLIKPMVEKICKEHGVNYDSVGFCHALKEVLSDFKRLSTALMSPEIIMG